MNCSCTEVLAKAAGQTAYITPDLSSPDASVRATAAHALRYVDDDEAKGALALVARQDSDAGVRARAVEALAYTPPAPDALPLYHDLLAAESSPTVVKEIAHNLFLLSALDPAALVELKAYSNRCGAPDLCPYVAGLVRAAQLGRHS